MKQREIIHYMSKYVVTGVIDDALIEFFDQHGKWCGDTIAWETPVPHSLLEKMTDSYLPASRRAYCSRLGSVLRTSFVQGGDEHIHTKHAEIHGSFIARGNAAIHAPLLRRIGGNLVSNTTRKVEMPWLSVVGGRVELLQTFLLRITRLRHVGGDMLIAGTLPPMLVSVGGRLGVYWAFSFAAIRLRWIGGCLVLSKSEEIRVPKLHSVGGGILLCHLAQRIVAPQLRSVGGDFLAGSLEIIEAPLLRIVKGDFDSSSAKGFYHPGIKVEGEWTVFPGAIREWELRDAARKAIRGEPFDI